MRSHGFSLAVGVPLVMLAAMKRSHLYRYVGHAGLWLLAILAGVWSVAVALFAVHPAGWGKALALGLLVVFGVLLWASRKARWRAGWCLLGTAGVALIMALAIRPHNARDWAFDVARPAWAEITGDVVTLHNYRDFAWESEHKAIERWTTKTVRLSQLRHVDFFMVYWGSPSICHTMVSFDFGPDGYVCVSAEARREVGESYSPVAGLFRAYELYYVFGEERDVVRVRSNHRANNELFLFRLAANEKVSRDYFLDFVKSAHAIKDQPVWYQSIVSNCTTVIRRHAEKLGLRAPWSWRLLANGHVDEYLYRLKYISTAQPLAALKEQSRITDRAREAGDDDFSAAIRAGLPGY